VEDELLGGAAAQHVGQLVEQFAAGLEYLSASGITIV
jgi:hypothetical protein